MTQVERKIRRPVVRGRRAEAGMTLIEVMLGMAGTAVIGAAVAAMLAAVSRGTADGSDMRALVVKDKTSTARMAAAIRSSSMVLAKGSDHLVLWMSDDNGDELPNVSEIRRIELESDGEMRSYSANFTGMTAAAIAAADTSSALSANFSTVTQSLKSQAYFPGELWATGVTAWSITLDETSAQAATLVSYRLTLSNGTLSEIAVGAAALRN